MTFDALPRRYTECARCRSVVRDGVLGHLPGCEATTPATAPSKVRDRWEQERVELWLPGRPVGYKRAPTVAGADGGSRRVTHLAYGQWLRGARAFARLDVGADLRYPDGPLTLTVIVNLPPPRSGRRWPTSPNDGDVDNFCKAVADALQAKGHRDGWGLYADDAQIVDAAAVKRFGDPAGVRVVVARPDGADRPSHETPPL